MSTSPPNPVLVRPVKSFFKVISESSAPDGSPFIGRRLKNKKVQGSDDPDGIETDQLLLVLGPYNVTIPDISDCTIEVPDQNDVNPLDEKKLRSSPEDGGLGYHMSQLAILPHLVILYAELQHAVQKARVSRTRSRRLLDNNRDDDKTDDSDEKSPNLVLVAPIRHRTNCLGAATVQMALASGYDVLAMADWRNRGYDAEALDDLHADCKTSFPDRNTKIAGWTKSYAAVIARQATTPWPSRPWPSLFLGVMLGGMSREDSVRSRLMCSWTCTEMTRFLRPGGLSMPGTLRLRLLVMGILGGLGPRIWAPTATVG